MKKVLIIGGGASGVFAAIAAKDAGCAVEMLEHTGRLLNKLRISGKGRCNITTAVDRQSFFQNVVRNPKFLMSSFSAFDNQKVIEYFHHIGVETKVERGMRVFPISDDANTVAEALVRELKKRKIPIHYRQRVQKFEIEDGAIQFAVCQSGQKYRADAYILATGGRSYPNTGSVGDGYSLAEQAGHRITEILPSLAPIHTKEKWVREVTGLSLKNVELKIMEKKKMVFRERGEMLFTHDGISGPLVLSASAHIERIEDARIEIDFKPALTCEQLDLRLQRDFLQYANREFQNSLVDLLPRSMIPVMVRLSGIDPQKRCNQLTKQERATFLALLKGTPLRIESIGPLEQAIVTRGGVDVRQMDPHTMQSKLCKNLYICGELLDLDAYTGGFNLQIAFSTGHAAGSAQGSF